jgi:hypothetical protein
MNIKRRGRLAILVVIGVVFAMSGLELAREKAKRQAISMSCVNNMMEISIAGREWAKEHGGKFPTNFALLSDRLISPILLLCPADPNRSKLPAVTGPFTIEELSNYFTTIDSSYEVLAQGVAIGDTNTAIFRCKIHGNLGYTDGVFEKGAGTKATYSDAR